MVSYRDELEAVRLKNEELMRDLAEAREKIAELENVSSTNAKLVKADPIALAKPPVRFGRIHFHRPRTYVPLMHVWKASVFAALGRAPKLGSFDSDSVLGWVAHYCLLVPLTYGVRIPLYYLSLCVALPVAFFVCLAFSPLLVLIVLASRFTFSSLEPSDGNDWFQGKVSEEQGAMFLWILESMCMQPLLLTTTTLLDND